MTVLLGPESEAGGAAARVRARELGIEHAAAPLTRAVIARIQYAARVQIRVNRLDVEALVGAQLEAEDGGEVVAPDEPVGPTGQRRRHLGVRPREPQTRHEIDLAVETPVVTEREHAELVGVVFERLEAGPKSPVDGNEGQDRARTGQRELGIQPDDLETPELRVQAAVTSAEGPRAVACRRAFLRVGVRPARGGAEVGVVLEEEDALDLPDLACDLEATTLTTVPLTVLRPGDVGVIDAHVLFGGRGLVDEAFDRHLRGRRLGERRRGEDPEEGEYCERNGEPSSHYRLLMYRCEALPCTPTARILATLLAGRGPRGGYLFHGGPIAVRALLKRPPFTMPPPGRSSEFSPPVSEGLEVLGRRQPGRRRRVELLGLLKGGAGLGRTPLLPEEDEPQHVVGGGQLRVQADRHLEGPLRFLVAAEVVEDPAEVMLGDVGAPERRERQRLAVLGARLLPPGLLGQRHTEVLVGLGIAVVEGDRLLELAHRLRDRRREPHVQEEEAERVVVGRISRIERHGLAELEQRPADVAGAEVGLSLLVDRARMEAINRGRRR